MSRKTGPAKVYEHRTTMRFDLETIQNLDFLKSILHLDSRSAVVRWMANKFSKELKARTLSTKTIGGVNKP